MDINHRNILDNVFIRVKNMIESISGIQIRETERNSGYRIDLGIGSKFNWGSIECVECTKKMTRQIFLLGGQYIEDGAQFMSVFNWISCVGLMCSIELDYTDAISIKMIMDSDLMAICNGFENVSSLEELSIKLDLMGFQVIAYFFLVRNGSIMDNDKIEELFSRISKMFLEMSGIELFFDDISNLLIRYSYMEDDQHISYMNNILFYGEICNARNRGLNEISFVLDMKRLFLFDEDISIFSHMRFVNEFYKHGNPLTEFESCEAAKRIYEIGIPKSVEELSIRLDLMGF